MKEAYVEHGVLLLTVGKLRQLLADLPDETIVIADGCDCIGNAAAIKRISASVKGDDGGWHEVPGLLIVRAENYGDWASVAES